MEELKKAPVTVLLILANILVFTAVEFTGGSEDTMHMLQCGAAYTPAIMQGEYYRIFTSMFLHFGPQHLGNNMLVLFVLGGRLERTVGKLKYLLIYLLGGMGGNLLCLFLELLHRPLIALFLDGAPSAQTVATGEGYLRFIGFFFCMIGFKMAVDGILRGAGAVKVFTIANLVNLGLRVLIAKLGAPVYGIAMIWYAVPLGWLANFLISYGYYRTGKWKQIK